MKYFYMVGPHIPAQDSRWLKILPRNLATEIAASLKTLKTAVLFSMKEKAQKYVNDNARKDKKGNITAISPLLEIYLIDEKKIHQESAAKFSTAEYNPTNIIVYTAEIDIPDAYDECEVKIDDGPVQKQRILIPIKYFNDDALLSLGVEIRSGENTIPQSVAEYYMGYVKKGFEHGISEKDLKEAPAIMITAAKAFFTVDCQDKAESIAKTLQNNKNWNANEIIDFLIQERIKFFNNNTKDHNNSIFLKKLDSVIVCLYGFLPKQALHQPDRGSTKGPVKLSIGAVEYPTAQSPKKSEHEIKLAKDVNPYRDRESNSSPTPSFPGQQFFAGAKSPAAVFVDQKNQLKELFLEAEKNPELAKFLLDQAQTFSHSRSIGKEQAPSPTSLQ